MNILTGERQHAYKHNKSTIDAIYAIKRGIVGEDYEWGILLSLSRTFGVVGGNKIREILFGEIP